MEVAKTSILDEEIIISYVVLIDFSYSTQNVTHTESYIIISWGK